MSLLPNLYYLAYMFGLILAFYLGFYAVMATARGYSFKTKVKYAATAGLLGTKFVVFAAALLGIDHVFMYVRIAWLRIPVSANLLLFLSNLSAILSLNWERVSKQLGFSLHEELD